jgi:environmental stress-induced protein Ves
LAVTRIIRAADCPEVPWKNGGGTTREIAVFPPGAGMNDFAWRLSMAKVDQPGPFSAFAGVDRTLAVIEGTLLLTGPSVDILLTEESPPCPFDGAAAIHGEPLAGPVLDLNAMVRRGHYACTMRRLVAGERAECAGTALLVALEPQPFGGHALDTLDCALFGAPLTVQGKALVVNFTAA